MGWATGAMHDKAGNLAMSDGSCQQVSSSGLRLALANSADNTPATYGASAAYSTVSASGNIFVIP